MQFFQTLTTKVKQGADKIICTNSSLQVFAFKCSFPGLKKPQSIEIIFDSDSKEIRIFRVSHNSKLLLDQGKATIIFKKWISFIWGSSYQYLSGISHMPDNSEEEVTWRISKSDSKENETIITTPNFAPPISVISSELEFAIFHIGVNQMKDELRHNTLNDHELNSFPEAIVKHNHRIYTLATEVDEIEL